jgi:hypothetical protein
MSEKLSVTLNVQVVGGPRISASWTKEVEAYDKVDVTVVASDTVEVDVQPSAIGQVEFLMISLADATQYGTDITYKISPDSPDAVNLDAPQVFIGTGAVGLLNLAAPTKLFFSNGLSTDASVQVLVGRDATPFIPIT